MNAATTLDRARVVPSLGVTALAIGLAVIELPVLIELVRVWWEVPYYSHGLLVPLWSAWLVWDVRRELRPGHGSTPLGAAVIALGLATLGAGALLGSLTVGGLSIPVLVLGIALMVLGPAQVRTVAFPIAFLVLMVPLPADALPRISLPLQHLAATVASAVLTVLAIPSAHDGLYIHLEKVTLHVSEACNGMRFLFAMIPVGIALAAAATRDTTRRVGIVAMAIAIAIVANLVRVTGTALIAHAWGPEAASGFLHLAYGKLIYAVMLVPFAAGVLLLRRRG